MSLRRSLPAPIRMAADDSSGRSWRKVETGGGRGQQDRRTQAESEAHSGAANHPRSLLPRRFTSRHPGGCKRAVLEEFEFQGAKEE